MALFPHPALCTLNLYRETEYRTPKVSNMPSYLGGELRQQKQSIRGR